MTEATSGISLRYCGGPTFAVSYRNIRFYMEPSAHSSDVTDADLLTVSGLASIDLEAIQSMLAASSRVKMVLPKAAGEHAHSLGIDYQRMTTTDAALRVEYFKNGEYGRVYGVPTARRDENGEPQLDWTPIGGFPQIGFMARFGGTTVWHSGPGVPYPQLAERLKPYSVSVALVAIGESAFTESEAADLAEAIEANWLIPAPICGDADRFVQHMLGHRPMQRFKVFEPGETWTLPGSD